MQPLEEVTARMDKDAGQQQISTLYCTLHPYMYIRTPRVTAGLPILISVLRTYFYFFFVNIVVRDLPTKCGPYLVRNCRAKEVNDHDQMLLFLAESCNCPAASRYGCKCSPVRWSLLPDFLFSNTQRGINHTRLISKIHSTLISDCVALYYYLFSNLWIWT